MQNWTATVAATLAWGGVSFSLFLPICKIGDTGYEKFFPCGCCFPFSALTNTPDSVCLFVHSGLG